MNNNTVDKTELLSMLEGGMPSLTKDELMSIIDNELLKDEAEIDTELIDTCFALMDCEVKTQEPAKPQLTLRRSVRTALIAAAVATLLISSLTVTAQIFNVNPFNKNAEIVVTTATKAKPATTKKVTSKKPSQAKPSTTSGRVVVPDFVFENYTKEQLEADKSVNNKFELVFEPVYEESEYYGMICAQSIEAGMSVPRGTRLVLSYIAEPEYAVMPEVYGLTGSDALDRVISAGLRGSISGSPDGEVINCNIQPGERVLLGTRVVIYTEDVTESTTEFTQDESQNTDTSID